jgi:hypothetical protein
MPACSANRQRLGSGAGAMARLEAGRCARFCRYAPADAEHHTCAEALERDAWRCWTARAAPSTNPDRRLLMTIDDNAATPRERTGFELTSPASVLDRGDLSRDEKVELLHQWEFDLREGMVAEDENMPATEPLRVSLDEILDALRALGAESGFRHSPTKHG